MPAGLQVALLAVVAAAALWDIRTRAIPNWITVPGALLGLALQSSSGGFHGMLSSLVGAGAGFGFFLLLHLAGGMGAGDVKLAAAVGALVGAKAFVAVFVATGLVGGAAALVLAAARGRLRRTFERSGQLLFGLSRLRWEEVRRLSALDEPGALRLPYGAVIAGGALVFLAFFR